MIWLEVLCIVLVTVAGVACAWTVYDVRRTVDRSLAEHSAFLKRYREEKARRDGGMLATSAKVEAPREYGPSIVKIEEANGFVQVTMRSIECAQPVIQFSLSRADAITFGNGVLAAAKEA